MASRHELIRDYQVLTQAVLAAEDWHSTYKTNEDTFDELTRLESALGAAIAEYFHELSMRASVYVDWSVLKAAGVAPADDPVWEEERRLLTVAVLQIITELTALGVIGGEYIIGIPVAFESLEDAIMQAARKQTATMVRSVTDTTRKLIREAVAQSIALGENSDEAALRLLDVIDNPIRAQTIAQTEPVNAYQRGYSLYAHQTGAVSKTWDGLIGACKICSPLIGTTIGIDELFTLANGNEVPHPSGHPRCRCSLIYNYPE